MRLYAIDRLILLLALGAGILFALHRFGQAPPEPLTDLSVETVREIRVLRKERLQLALLRDSEGWMITHPTIARADATRVAQLLALPGAPARESWPVSPELLASGGLEAPRRSLHFDRVRIDFGGASTPPGLRYVRVGEHIHLVDELWFQLSGLPAGHYQETP